MKDGRVLAMDSDGAAKDVTPTLQGKIMSIAVAQPNEPVAEDRVLLKACQASCDTFYLLDTSTGSVKPLPVPSREAKLLAVGSAGRTVVGRAGRCEVAPASPCAPPGGPSRSR